MFTRIFFIAFVLSLALFGCINAKRIRKSFDVNKRYEGWYVATSIGHYFVKGSDHGTAKKVAFNLPQHSLNYSSVPDSFFYYDCKAPEIVKRYFLIEGDSTYGGKVFICRASAVYRGIAKENENYTGNIYKIKASDGKVVIKGIWYEHFVDLRDVVLYSNCDLDTIRFH